MHEPRKATLLVSVVVPVYSGGAALAACLEAIASASPAPFEVIVVVDGGDPEDLATAKRFGARTITLAERGGPARARNRGALEARGDVLLFVDADVLIRPDAIERVAAYLDREPDVTAVFGSYDEEPGAPNFLSQYKNLLHHYVHQSSHEDATTFWAGCGAVRRGDFLAVGGFDERYRRPCVEDIELGYRLTQANHRIKLDRELQAKHLKHWSAFALVKSDLFDRAFPWTELIAKGSPLVNDLNTRWASRLSSALACISLTASAGSVVWPELTAVTVLALAALIALNRPLYAFFLRKRGVAFAAVAVFWHMLYFFYAGLAFAIGMTVAQLRVRGSEETIIPALEAFDEQ